MKITELMEKVLETEGELLNHPDRSTTPLTYAMVRELYNKTETGARGV